VTTPSPFRIRQPADLIALAPHLLGFAPVDSVVVLVFGGGRITTTARYDLSAVLALPPSELFAGLLALAQYHGGERLFTITYAPRGRARRARDRLRRGFGTWLDDALIVDPAQGRWWPAGAPMSDPGSPLPDGAAAAEWARQAGLSPVKAARERLLDDLAAPEGEAAARLLAAWTAVTDWAAQAPDRLRRHCFDAFLRAPDRDWTDADYLTAAVLVGDPALRDVLWWELDRETAPALLRFWSEVARRVPPQRRALALAVTGLVAWQAGEGGLMGVCHEEAERLDAHAPVVGLLATIRDRSAHPDFWDQSRAFFLGPSRPEPGAADLEADGIAA
jgi:hypothetical protein